jgi:hypothetical protein
MVDLIALRAANADRWAHANPITHARGVLKIHEQASDPQRVFLDELEGLKERLGKLETVNPRAHSGRE